MTVVCIGCALVTIFVINENAHPSRPEIFHLLGWFPIGLADTLNPLLLTMLLFSGPLFERTIVESGWKQWITGKPLIKTLSSWIGWRNFVAVGSPNLREPHYLLLQGPVSEEVLFRSLMTPLSLLTPLTARQTIFLTPLYFGVAHVHHFYEFRLTHPRVRFMPALLTSLFQFSYTTLFGWYANFVFIRTGNLLSVILAHSFCNWMGLPRVWGRVEAGVPLGPVDENTPPVGTSGQPWNYSGQESKRRLNDSWTVVYYVLLVTGAAAFWRCFWNLTESPGKLASI